MPVDDHEVETESDLVVRVAFALDLEKWYFAVGVIIDTVGGTNIIGAVVTFVDAGFADEIILGVNGFRPFDTEFELFRFDVEAVDIALLFVNENDVLVWLICGDTVALISELVVLEDDTDELSVTGFGEAVNFTLLLVENNFVDEINVVASFFVVKKGLEVEDVGITVVA